jgi:hypothetical protein
MRLVSLPVSGVKQPIRAGMSQFDPEQTSSFEKWLYIRSLMLGNDQH